MTLLKEHVPEVEVWAYGSRVNGQSHDASDLDLVLRGPSLEKIPSLQLADLKEAFTESNIPFFVEARDWARLPESFHIEIESNFAELQFPSIVTYAFEDLATLVRDNVSPSDCSEVPYIGLEHIGEATLSLSGVGIASDVKSTKLSFRPGDILFGKLRPYFKKVVQPSFAGICSSDIWVIRPTKLIDTRYLFFILSTQEFVDYAMQGSAGTRMPRAQWDHVSNFEVNLPPMREQQRIANILGALHDKIELNRRMIQTLEDMARLLYREWFVHFRFPGHEDVKLVDSDLGLIPEGWEVCYLSDVLELTYGKSLKADKRMGGPVSVYGSGGQVGWHNEALVAGPGIVVGRKGNVGSVYWSDHDFFPIDTTYYVKSKLPFRYLDQMLRTQKFLDSHAAVPGLSRDQAYGLRFARPDDSFLSEYELMVQPIYDLRKNLIQQNLLLCKTRDHLLPRLLSGELDVSELDLDLELAAT